MSVVQRLLIACFGVVSIYAAPALAQNCKPDEVWSHSHATAEHETIADEIKGSRATIIEICRDTLASGADLKTTVQFAGNKGSTELAQGKCVHKLAKWASVRSIGAQAAAGTPAEAKGVYRVCKD